MRLVLGLRRLALWLSAFAVTTAMAQVPALKLVAKDLVAPIQLEELPDGSGRMLVVQQNGLVRVLMADGSVAVEPLVDLRPQMLVLVDDFEERGLLGFALHPEFVRNGRFVVTYSAPLRASAPRAWNHTRRVSEFQLKPGTLGPVDLATERVLIEQDWPSRKHNGGALAFGPDGLLYIGFGDSGASHGIGPKVLHEAFDVPAALLIWDLLAQDLHSLYGKVLRIDLDRGFPGYAIPPTNPLVGKPGRPEVYAWGFRNPYRIAFDRNGSGDFYLTATAETLWEAAYRVRRPGNFGWPLIEGTHCLDRLKPREPPATCARSDADGQPLELPVVEYANMQVQHPASKLGIRGVGTAITGARVYRGQAIARLQGQLLFSDWSATFRQPSGQLFTAKPGEGTALWPFERLLQVDSRIIGLAEDRAGEIYVLTHEGLGPFGATGKVFKLVAAP